MNFWWAFALISGAGLASRNVLFKLVSGKLDPAFASLVLAIGMTGISVIYYFFQRVSTNEALIPETVPVKATALCLLAGAGVAFANIFLALAYKQGGYASLTAILQNGFSIVLTILIGYLFLTEVIKPMQMVGILFAFTGIILITRG